jgi:hypothetical protein
MSEYSSKLKFEVQPEVEYLFRLGNSESTFVAFCTPSFSVKNFSTVSSARGTPSATFTVHCKSMFWIP